MHTTISPHHWDYIASPFDETVVSSLLQASQDRESPQDSHHQLLSSEAFFHFSLTPQMLSVPGVWQLPLFVQSSVFSLPSVLP